MLAVLVAACGSTASTPDAERSGAIDADAAALDADEPRSERLPAHRGLVPELGAFPFTVPGTPAAQIDFLAARGFAGVVVPWPTAEEAREVLEHPAVRAGAFRIDAFLRNIVGGLDTVVIDGWATEAARNGFPLWVTLDGPDAELVSVVATLDRIAEAHGIDVALYPHDGLALRSAEQAIALIEGARAHRVKVTLHLSHELKAGNRDRLAAVIGHALPLIAGVTINGSFTEDGMPSGDFSRVILPLDEGDLDVQRVFFEPLIQGGYRGPLTLHTWGIAESPESHLVRSRRTYAGWVEDAFR